MMLDASIVLLRALAERHGDVGAMARAVLLFEGALPTLTPMNGMLTPMDGAPLSPAERQRRRRDRHAMSRSSVTNVTNVTNVTEPVTADVTADVTASVTRHAPPAPPEIQDKISSLSGDLQNQDGEGRSEMRATNVTNVTEPVTADVTERVTVTHAPLGVHRFAASNWTADGCDGMAVQELQAGIAKATGRPFVIPRSGQNMTTVVDHLHAGAPDATKRIDWARAKGAAFGRSTAQKTVFGLLDWLNDPNPKKSSNAVPLQTDGPGGRIWKVGKGSEKSPEIIELLAKMKEKSHG